MKKRILAAGIALAIAMAAVPATFVASAEVSVEECDKIFAETINSLIDGSEVENGSVSATRKPLYDISIEPLGYIYEFSLKDSEGYAIVINTDGKYIAQEFIPNGVSPYAECEGTCIYVDNMTYLAYSDGVYTSAESGAAIPDEIIDYLAEDALYGDTGLVTGSTSLNVTFKSRTYDDYRMAPSVPCNTSSPYNSSCACIAGGNIISYFDRYCTELIPNYEPGYEYLGYYFYNGATTEAKAIIPQLYSDMGTTESNGTTVAGFLSGMTKYAKRAGYTFSYSSCMSSGKFNYTTAKNKMKSGQPVALFLSGYNIGMIASYENYDSITYVLSDTNHAMVGFGYQDITYTYESGEQETVEYIYVASGYHARQIGYFNINYNTKIDNAYAVSIY